MSNKATPMPSAATPDEPQLRLSPWRVILASVIVLALAGAGVVGFQALTAKAAPAAQKWFAGYADVTATPQYAFESASAKAANDVVLSFVVASSATSCTPSWGGSYSLEQAASSLDLDRRIARLEQKGGGAIVSFGGQKNAELATACTDASSLEHAYKSVVDRYSLRTIDLDIEGTALSDADTRVRRAQAVAELQSSEREAGHPLAVWLTLPVSPTGLTQDGTDTVAAMLAAGVDIAGVNAMTMDYGSAKPANMSMLKASENALTATERQLGVLYKEAKTPLSDATLWSKVGVTPMIGVNDTPGETFTLADAAALNAFAHEKGVGRVSMWSLNRDQSCGPNYVDTQTVSDSCSGIDQKGKTFVAALSKGFTGHSEIASSLVTTPDATPTAVPTDNPATSPYQIWSKTGVYLEGTKVVWHHNVYVAKWWTSGDTPDNPVLQSWQTPWTLVGPVLPGEKPIPQATLPAGTYPEWSGTATYDAGGRVLFKGTPYEAKWWNQGQSPAASASDPDDSPWTPLTQAQINELVSPATPTPTPTPQS
jgi:chitinase